MPTAVLGEVETAEALGHLAPGPEPSAWRQGQNPYVTAPGSQKTRSNTAVAVVMTALGMLLLFGAAGIGAWLYSRSSQPDVYVSGDRDALPNTNTVAASTPLPKTSPSPAKTPAPTPARDVETSPDNVQTRIEIQDRLDSWNKESESLDLDTYMTHYAPTVDYYNKTGASRADVRRDKQRAFSRYDSVSINLTNISITTATDGQTATALVDKEWDFQGNGSSSGKVQQMLRFAKIDGEWLITAEKDLKLFYKR